MVGMCMPWRVLEAMGDATICGDRLSSVGLRGTWRHLETHRGTQKALSGNQRHSEALRYTSAHRSGRRSMSV